MKRHLVLLIAVFFAFGTVNITEAITFAAVDSGWFRNHGVGQSSTNYARYFDYHTCGVFYVFDLSNLHRPAGSAVLQLGVTNYNSPDLSELLTVFDVITPVAALLSVQGKYPSDSAIGILFSIIWVQGMYMEERLFLKEILIPF
jgi:hypothetical protein